MTFPNIRRIATIWLAGAMMTFGGMQSALAHWGHLGELAGHGHLVGAGLGAAAAVMAAALVARRRDENSADDSAADTDSGETEEPEGDLADA